MPSTPVLFIIIFGNLLYFTSIVSQIVLITEDCHDDMTQFATLSLGSMVLGFVFAFVKFSSYVRYSVWEPFASLFFVGGSTFSVFFMGTQFGFLQDPSVCYDQRPYVLLSFGSFVSMICFSHMFKENDLDSHLKRLLKRFPKLKDQLKNADLKRLLKRFPKLMKRFPELQRNQTAIGETSALLKNP